MAETWRKRSRRWRKRRSPVRLHSEPAIAESTAEGRFVGLGPSFSKPAQLRGDLVTTEQNKSIVRRFWREVIVDGNLDILQDVVSPGFRDLDGLGNDVDRL